MQHPQPDDSAWQACVVRRRAMTGLWVVIVAGWLRFMHQRPNTRRVIYLHPEMIVTNDDIAQSWVLEDGPDHFGVSVEFLQPGAERMRQATAGHVGRPVAILIDGAVVTAPILRSAISDVAMITGDYTRAEAQRIADGIGIR